MVIRYSRWNDPNDPCDYDPASVTLAVTSMVDCDGDGVTDADEIAAGPIQTIHVVTMFLM
ncbi:hypothetical protein [Nonlabens tegetincola]|uniref:hypothetical protein n=1 Tax=Nonlabens tegetincola TaxID=323273 RepID=UPI0011B00B00|nr:hypothetical protein [Nonlabens tegetincola]